MTTRIAFLSCTRMGFKDTSDLPTTHADYPCKIKDKDFDQPIWAQLTQMHARQPFHAVLFLGDQIYSDYWPWNGGGDRPRYPSWTVNRFHAHMYKMYKTQYEDAIDFREFVIALNASGTQIGMTWDDHDFGYNKSYDTDYDFRCLCMARIKSKPVPSGRPISTNQHVTCRALACCSESAKLSNFAMAACG